VWSIYAPFAVRLERKLRTHLFRKIASFSYERIEATSSGDWMTRLNTDVEMPFSRGFHLPHAACAIVSSMMSAVILGWMNPTVLGLVFLFVIPQIILTQCLIARSLPKLNQAALEHIAKNTSELTALITCADVAVLYDGQPYLLNRFRQSSLALLRANMKIRARNALSSFVTSLFGLGGYLVLLIVSCEWIAKGYATFGDLTAVFQYRSGILVAATMLINCILSIQSSMAGIRRFNEIMFESKGRFQTIDEMPAKAGEIHGIMYEKTE
jgi:ABC-type multidrug transport system fused ATPase/permease subunit